MFKLTYLILVLILLQPLGLTAQLTDAEYLLGASELVYATRYKEVRGSPYRYGTFRPGTLFDVAGNRFEVDLLNFNGFSSRFEYKAGGDVRELYPYTFIRAELTDDDGTKHTYSWSANPRFKGKYTELLYRGKFLTATMIYDVANRELVRDVGRTVQQRRFGVKKLYYVSLNGELKALTLTPKKVAASLGFEREIRRFIDRNRLTPRQREDLLRILAFTDELYGK